MMRCSMREYHLTYNLLADNFCNHRTVAEAVALTDEENTSWEVS
jgi:hypothetical protein